uniref:Protein kinase domain-containing protein n=1 Tax=Meloidogyne incognita TaxID=6306 RepID=A0A914KUW3_MELIC
MFSTNDHLITIKEMIKTCAVDVRDEWPTDPANYAKSETIQRGTFGVIRFAEASDYSFGLDGFETRTCVIKTIYLQRIFEDILKVDELENSQGQLDIHRHDGNFSKNVSPKLFHFYQRLMMEMFVLSRCRHANIMHLHSAFISDGDLHIVLPRLYVLKDIVLMYKRLRQSEPIPISIIAKILRQICLGLDFLQKIGIIHRDVQPENIFLTRGATVKLGHFSQSKALFEEVNDEDNELLRELGQCKTPVGREEYMCIEKQLNLELWCEHQRSEAGYSFSADMWSLGVLILHMVSYFPDEQCQKLHKNFALIMHEEQLPFIWLTVDMLQLRSRLVKSGGEELKLFLNDHLLTVNPKQRSSASSLLKTQEMKKWCLANVEADSAFLRSHFINEVDFANQMKLEADSPNYDALETKDIPAEFYWDDRWRLLEETELYFLLVIHLPNRGPVSKGQLFKFSHPEPFFRLIYLQLLLTSLDFTNLLKIDYEVRQTLFEFIRQYSTNLGQNTAITSKYFNFI